MGDVPRLALNDGRMIPQLGYGVWQTPPEETARVVGLAIAAGYRSIDTAPIYYNEAGVGEGVRASAVNRSELFVTSKLWNSDQSYDRALAAFDRSLAALGLAYLDLFLIHWPAPSQGLYVQAWKALIRLREEGRVRSIGVSNFNPDHLERIIGETGVTPVINQVELHPRFQQAAVRAAGERVGMLTECWSPLGRGRLMQDPTLAAIALKHRRTVPQVILRWHLQLGLVVIPKSVTPGRIVENFALFDFALEEADMAAIARLDSPGGRVGPDPARM